MKKLALTGIATLALAAGAFAQGLVAIDDSLSNGGIQDPAGTYYSGPFGMEVWDLNATAVPAGLNGNSTPGTIAGAYTAMSGTFTMETEFNGTMSSGTFSGPTVTMTKATPAGANVVIALAVWNNSMTSWAAGTAVLGSHGNIDAFVNPTVAPSSSGPPPTPASLSGFNDTVVMSAVGVPEPGTLALAGLGLASLLIFRRRK